MVVTLESPKLFDWTKTHAFGYEFVHLTDSVNVTYIDESFSYAGLPLNIKLPSVNNISILSSGNITKGTSDIVKIASGVPSMPFVIAKTTEGNIDTILNNSTNYGIGLRCKQTGSSSYENLCVISPRFTLLSNDTALIMQAEMGLTETSLPVLWAYNGDVLHEFEILDTGLVVYTPSQN